MMTQPNKSLEQTPVGALSSAFAVDITGPAWLSLKSLGGCARMRFILPILLLVCSCRGPRQAYISPDTPQSYFTGLPSVSVPPSPYSDRGQTEWFSIGYREGWQRGSSGVNAHPDPWYPQHQQCIRVSGFAEAHRRGFDAGFKLGFEEAQQRLAQTIESLGRQATQKSDSP